MFSTAQMLVVFIVRDYRLEYFWLTGRKLMDLTHYSLNSCVQDSEYLPESFGEKSCAYVRHMKCNVICNQVVSQNLAKVFVIQ